MSELPKGWVECALGEVCELSMGQSPSGDATNLDGNGIYLIGGASDFGNETPTPSRYTSKPTKICKIGDILLCIRATIGKVNTADKEYCIGRGAAALSPTLSNNSFIKYFLIKEAEALDNAGTGTTFRQVDKKTLQSWPFPLPPANEQRRIVEKVDSLLARSARARDQLAPIPRLVERYKQAVLAKAFSGELTAEWRISRPADETTNNLLATTPEPEKTRGGRSATETIIEGRAALSVNMSNRLLPLTWAWVPLSRVSRQETGHTPSRSHPEYWDGTIPWLSIPDANHCHGGEIKDTSQHITELGIQNSSARILPKETVCLSRTASVGYVVKMGQDMATSQDFVTWTCTGALDPDYLLFALLSEGDDIVRFGKGSTHKTIYFPEVRAFHISLAPFDEQKEIVRRIQSAFAWIDRIAAEQTNAAKLLGKLDQAVLAKAFRGELVPQDPNDEPASVLLDRIRQERAAQPKAKRQPRRSSTKPQE